MGWGLCLQLATPGNPQAKVNPALAETRTPGASRAPQGEEKPSRGRRGVGRGQTAPGAARAAGQASFRADAGCLCSSQVGMCRTPPHLRPAPAQPGPGLMPPPSCLLNILAILGPGILEGWTPGESQNQLAVAPEVSRAPGRGQQGHQAHQHSREGLWPRRPSPRALLAAE